MSDDRLTTYTMLPVEVREDAEKARALVATLGGFKVDGPESANMAGALRKNVHGEIKRLDALRLEVGKPAREAQKDVNAFFASALEPYKQAKALLGAKLSQHQAALEAERLAALAEASKGDTAALARAVPPPPTTGVRYQDRVHVIVDDIDKVPRKYLTLDWSALNLLAKAGAEAPEGVRFVRTQEAVVGR